MCFKVKATVIGWLGKEDKYPCHFKYQIGDEIIFDGERCHGRVCPPLWEPLVRKMQDMAIMGPRYVEPFFYNPFWYAPCSVVDLEKKKYDGVGWSNVFENYEEDSYSMAKLLPPDAFKWPPHPVKDICRETTILCPDTRAGAILKVEAYDLADQGYHIPFYRRQMMIMSKVLQKPKIPLHLILDEFTEKEKLEIYPALTKEMLIPLIDELNLLNFVEIRNGVVSVTKRGEDKLHEFIDGLLPEDREALKL